ncbi:hypothetical protein LRP30_33055 [Bradyrhizobium sp. C-145]|uniref:hypothetical protein n=1 Tax=Bradyrhizobium sp. C-145 TaxID=574727 RepID=UPI00201B5C28|nr:hypothetical protein [Bradyrhizobium sp. C-145]UQR61615.1 hypothetical protein LRP30_33055 [Bradyrhizobium sp. C-145]
MGNDTRGHLFDLIVADPIRDISRLSLAVSSARSKSTLRDFALWAATLVQSMAAAKVGYDLPYCALFELAVILDNLTGARSLSLS